MDYECPERKQPSLHGRKFTPTLKFLGTAKAYFFCHIGPIFQIFFWFMPSLGVRSPWASKAYWTKRDTARGFRKLKLTLSFSTCTYFEFRRRLLLRRRHAFNLVPSKHIILYQILGGSFVCSLVNTLLVKYLECLQIYFWSPNLSGSIFYDIRNDSKLWS